jgi:hypothetical protein
MGEGIGLVGSCRNFLGQFAADEFLDALAQLDEVGRGRRLEAFGVLGGGYMAALGLVLGLEDWR